MFDKYQRWGSVYTPEPGSVTEAYCGICNSLMDVQRNTYKQEGIYSRSTRVVDWFSCTYKDKRWHRQAEILWGLIEKSPSRTIKKLLYEEVQEILVNRKPTVDKEFY
jgi:hypothetical protein